MRKVLLIDDEYYFRQGLKQSTDWERYGFVVAGEAKNGKEALEFLEKEPADVLFLDINMPIMNGLELLGCLSERGIRPYTVLLTGYAEFEYARKALHYGVREYLLKPVDKQDIDAVLKQLAAYFKKSEEANRIVLDKPKNYNEIHTLEKKMREHIAEAFQSIALDEESVSPSELLARKVRRFIRENYQNPGLSETDISRAVFVNTSHLCAVFKKATGTTIITYLNSFRMDRAKELFDGGNSVVLDVSARVGFNDSNYFGKCFKRAFGISPSQYISLGQSRGNE